MGQKGLMRIGYLHNKQYYLKDIANAAGLERIDPDKLNEHIDNEWDSHNVICYNEELAEVACTGDDICAFFIDTGYKEKDTDEVLFACFYRNTPGSLEFRDEDINWMGGEIGTKAMLLKYLASFDLFSYVYSYDLVSKALLEKTGIEFKLEECKKVVQDSYIIAIENNMLDIVINERDANKTPIAAFFPIINYTAADGKKLFIKAEANTKKNAMQKWYGAYVVTEDDLKEELLSFCVFHVGYFSFASWSDSNNFFNSLAQKAMKENWQWKEQNSKKDYNSQPILRSYLEHTYYRLLDEDANAPDDKKKIIIYNGKCYFNSGLLDRNFRQIVIVGDISPYKKSFKGIGECQWDLISNLKAYSQNEPEIARMFPDKNDLPRIASYFSEYSQVVFDAKLNIHMNDNHIFEDGVARGRLPKYKTDYEKVKDNEEEKDILLRKIARDFDSARDRAKLMAERNYKLAVPQFWKETGEIQFLLPIYLGEREEAENPQCALVLSLDKSGRKPYYRGETIITLDMAYNNTRLIAKPDVFWLNELADTD